MNNNEALELAIESMQDMNKLDWESKKPEYEEAIKKLQAMIAGNDEEEEFFNYIEQKAKKVAGWTNGKHDEKELGWRESAAEKKVS